MNYEIMK